ncbi:hypothetical protein BHM03_00022336 [Ensete ventricosum]|nr:hypothetical protein BHM03_00022336 [Ensete ventricosum]
MKGRGRYNGKGERGESERDRVKKNGYLEKNKREPRITSEELCQFPYPYPLRSSSSSSEEEDNVTEMEGKGVWVGCADDGSGNASARLDRDRCLRFLDALRSCVLEKVSSFVFPSGTSTTNDSITRVAGLPSIVSGCAVMIDE